MLYHTWTTQRQTLNLLSLSAPFWLNSAPHWPNSAPFWLNSVDIESQDATHVVTGILWGAQTVVVGRRGLINSAMAQGERSRIKSELTRLASCIDDGKKAASVEQVKRENSHEATSFEIYSDLVAGDGAVTTSSVRAASRLLQKIPRKLVSRHECNGVPIVFTLTPLSGLQHLIGTYIPRRGPVPMGLETMRQVAQQFDFCANAQRGSGRKGNIFEAFRSVKVEGHEPKDKCSLIDLTEDTEDGQDKSSFEADFRFELAKARAGKSTYNDVLEFLRRRRGVSAAHSPRGSAQAAQPSLLLPPTSSSPPTRVKTLKEEDKECDILPSPVSSLPPALITTLKRQGGEESRQTGEDGASDNDDDELTWLVTEGKACYVTSNEVADMVQQEQNLYVFYFDDTSRGTPAWEQNIVFLSVCAEDSEDPNIIALCNCTGHAEASPTPRIDYYHARQLLYEDVVRTPLNCVAMYDGSELVRDVPVPQDSHVIGAACPGEFCDPLSPRIWFCDVCNTQLRYAEDGFIYCVCGRNPIDAFEFQCSSDLHGEEFVKYETGLLKFVLDALLGDNETEREDECSAPSQPGEADAALEDQDMDDQDMGDVMMEDVQENDNEEEERGAEQTEVESLNEVNILLLGESGVGKSLFVNAFLNYMRFASLDEAMFHDDLIAPAPLSRSLRSDRNDGGSLEDPWPLDMASLSRMSNNGRAFNNWQEDIAKMMSSTESSEPQTLTCVVHKLTTRGRTLQVIDSPGLADDFPSEQNKRRMAEVISTVGQVGAVHGILVLLDPISPHLTPEGCVNQLLSYFHRDAAPNVAFGFTRSAQRHRDANRDAYKPLKVILSQLESRGVRIDRESVFSFDSECYLFLAAAKKGMIPMENSHFPMATYRDMWEQAAGEARRIVHHFESLPQHVAQSTVDLYSAQRVVGVTSKPLAEVLTCVLDTIRVTTVELDHPHLFTVLRNKRDSFVKFVVVIVDSLFPRTSC